MNSYVQRIVTGFLSKLSTPVMLIFLLAFFPSKGFGLPVDSTYSGTGFPPFPTYTAPSLTSTTYVDIPLESPNGAGINYGGTNCGPPNNIGATDSSPYQLHFNGTTQISVTVPYSGYYTITGNLFLQQETAPGPVYYVIQVFASSLDVSGNPSSVLLYDSGDMPRQLDLNSTSTSNNVAVTLYGGAYLRKGSTIYAPRIWTTNVGSFCVGIPGVLSTFTISLIKTP